jgi:hypothetical protein
MPNKEHNIYIVSVSKRTRSNINNRAITEVLSQFSAHLAVFFEIIGGTVRRKECFVKKNIIIFILFFRLPNSRI